MICEPSNIQSISSTQECIRSTRTKKNHLVEFYLKIHTFYNSDAEKITRSLSKMYSYNLKHQALLKNCVNVTSFLRLIANQQHYIIIKTNGYIVY